MADLGTMIGGAWRCRRLAAALVDYSEGTLAPPARARVERHLAGCSRCAATVAALIDVPATLRGTGAVRDDAFWAAQRQRVMERIGASALQQRFPRRGFDWRLALPVAAAAVIAVAGYLSLRPPAAPGVAALDALPPADLAALIDVADTIVPTQEMLPDDELGGHGAVVGALEAGWIRADDAPGWGELDGDDLETLHGMLG